ncbi:M28 family peptidase [Massilia sp. B-10]|nr:M28 family peptidase [Massilia sp. B-10]
MAADAPATAFSSGALVHLRQIARESHPTGSPANAAVRDYLVTQLRALGLAPEVHSGVGLRARQGAGGLSHVDNVLVRLPGTVPGKAVLLAAHYDSAPLSLGAADDGASVAAILETLRALKAARAAAQRRDGAADRRRGSGLARFGSLHQRRPLGQAGGRGVQLRIPRHGAARC